MKDYQTYIHLSKYARWRDEDKRRETWDETVERYVDYFETHITWPELTNSILIDLQEAIKSFEVMPSMRCLWSAGKALDRDNVAGYNCAAVAVNHQRVFDEIFYLLMCGCGVGYSVERQYINLLPEIAEEFFESDSILVVADSKIGWASSLRELISLLYSGKIPKWDLSKIRPAGARLKTFGGRASGPEYLDKLFRRCVRTFSQAKGRRLNSLEVFDLVCYIADCVISGSVRRSACICLSNLTDERMRKSKFGEWYLTDPQRQLANISTAYTEKPDLDAFIKEFQSMHRSKAGERGIINKEALRKQAERCGRDYEGDYLLNPCAEAILRDTGGLCNLTEVVIRPTDTFEDLKRKVELATVLGTMQSTLTDFRYLRKIWKDNAEEERLLGISLTGIMDHPVMAMQLDDEPGLWDWFGSTLRLEDILSELKNIAKETNKIWSKMFGISPSKQLSLVKPSGTVSQLVNCSAGIHPRMFPYYIRNIRQDMKDPLSQLMIDQKIPYVQQKDKYIFQFPLKSPKNSICSNDITALEQLRLWKVYRDYWCEGNPSQTIYYTDDEFFEIANWIWKNWDSIGGLSFFPKNDNIYDLAPYEEITNERYIQLLETFPETVEWNKLSEYETTDSTSGAQEVACASGECEI